MVINFIFVAIFAIREMLSTNRDLLLNIFGLLLWIYYSIWWVLPQIIFSNYSYRILNKWIHNKTIFYLFGIGLLILFQEFYCLLINERTIRSFFGVIINSYSDILEINGFIYLTEQIDEPTWLYYLSFNLIANIVIGKQQISKQKVSNT